jgi:formylmethanofuran dehydrogenase subunit E-like metal-binding protein
MTAKNPTVEHCLLVMSGDTVSIDSKDEKLIQSLARQIDRGIGLTDRQLNLARKKLDEYADQLTQQEIDVNQAKQNIKLPVRQIDRSRWIRFADSDEGAKIQVRFAFQKKLIQAIDSVKKQIPSSQRTYDPDTKTHTFDYSESNLYEIVTAFKSYDFDVDEDILDLYRDLCELDPSDVMPGIYGFETRILQTLLLCTKTEV